MATAGPWRLNLNEKQTEAEVIGADEYCVASFDLAGVFQFEGKDAHETEVANARLIAAAPDMLAALKLAEATISIVAPRNDRRRYLACLEQIRAAIAKAQGGGR